jgi:glutamine synthetase
MMIMNTIVGDQLNSFIQDVADVEAEGKPQDRAIMVVLRRYINESLPILFEGDGYSKEWEEEAKRRGLSNFKNTPEALQAFKTQKVNDLFNRSGVLTKIEQEAHYAVMFENYNLA